MSNRVMFVALALLLLAGCSLTAPPQYAGTATPAPTAERAVTREDASARQAAITPTPAQYDDGPMPTYADPARQHVVYQNTADAMRWQVTEIALNRQATEAAATQAAVDRDAAILAATRQVEGYNAAATAYANSVQMTATAGAIALQNAQADVTATARAGAMLDAQATAEAARANELRTEAQETARRAQQADLDRQTWYVVKLALGLMALVLGGMVGWHLVRLLGVYVAIKARRMLVIEHAGLYIDAQTGRPEVLPGSGAPMLPAGNGQARDERLHDAIKPAALEAGLRANERTVRQAWKLQAWHFLRWSEHTPAGDEESVGFSRRRLCDAANISEGAYHVMIGFLADLGLIEKENTGNPRSPWALARGGDGQPMTVSQALRHTVWLTSFDTPDTPSLPWIPHAPARTSRHHTTPHQPHHNTPHQHTSENEPESPKNTGWNLSLPPESLRDIDGEGAAEAG